MRKAAVNENTMVCDYFAFFKVMFLLHFSFILSVAFSFQMYFVWISNVCRHLRLAFAYLHIHKQYYIFLQVISHGFCFMFHGFYLLFSFFFLFLCLFTICHNLTNWKLIYKPNTMFGICVCTLLLLKFLIQYTFRFFGICHTSNKWNLSGELPFSLCLLVLRFVANIIILICGSIINFVL